MTYEILALLVVFQFKHLIADYYLQFPYMYENKGKSTGWIVPLLDHSSVHAGLTSIVLLTAYYILVDEYVANNILVILLGSFVLDFTTHFITDRWKATRKFGPSTAQFWYNLGIDQMVHHVVGVFIVFWFFMWI